MAMSVVAFRPDDIGHPAPSPESVAGAEGLNVFDQTESMTVPSLWFASRPACKLISWSGDLSMPRVPGTWCARFLT